MGKQKEPTVIEEQPVVKSWVEENVSPAAIRAGIYRVVLELLDKNLLDETHLLKLLRYFQKHINNINEVQAIASLTTGQVPNPIPEPWKQIVLAILEWGVKSQACLENALLSSYDPNDDSEIEWVIKYIDRTKNSGDALRDSDDDKGKLRD